MLFTPLVNGPVIGVITARTPVELRPKMMTALISISTLAAPLGFLVAGQLLEPWGVNQVFAAVAVGMTATALVFAAIALRAGEKVPERRDGLGLPAASRATRSGRSPSGCVSTCTACSNTSSMFSSVSPGITSGIHGPTCGRQPACERAAAYGCVR